MWMVLWMPSCFRTLPDVGRDFSRHRQQALLLVVLVVVAIWIHRRAATCGGYAHTSGCCSAIRFRHWPDHVGVASAIEWDIDLVVQEVNGFHSPVVITGVHLEAGLLAVVV